MDWFLRSAMERIEISIKLKNEGEVVYNYGAMNAMADAISMYLIQQYPDINYAISNNKEDYNIFISFMVHPYEHYDEMMDLLKRYFK